MTAPLTIATATVPFTRGAGCIGDLAQQPRTGISEQAVRIAEVRPPPEIEVRAGTRQLRSQAGTGAPLFRN